MSSSLVAQVSQLIQSSVQLDDLPPSLIEALHIASAKECQGMVANIKRTIKNKRQFPTVKLRALKVLVLGMETRNPVLFANVAKKMLRRLTIMAQYRKDSPSESRGATIFTGLSLSSSQETNASVAFLTLLLRSLRDWGESWIPDVKESEAFQAAYRQLLDAGVTFPPKFIPVSKRPSRILENYRDLANSLLKHIRSKNPDIALVQTAAEKVENSIYILRTEIEERFNQGLDPKLLLEVSDQLCRALETYTKWLHAPEDSGDLRLPIQIAQENIELLRQPEPLPIPELEDDLSDTSFDMDSFQLPLLPDMENQNSFVRPKQNFDDSLEEEITQEKVDEAVKTRQNEETKRMVEKHSELLMILGNQEDELIAREDKLQLLKEGNQETTEEIEILQGKIASITSLLDQKRAELELLKPALQITQDGVSCIELETLKSSLQSKTDELSSLRAFLTSLKDKKTEVEKSLKTLGKVTEKCQSLKLKRNNMLSTKEELEELKRKREMLALEDSPAPDLMKITEERDNLIRALKSSKSRLATNRENHQQLISKKESTQRLISSSKTELENVTFT